MNHPPLIRRKHEEPEDEGWLITFADMAVLLMCFFVLLFGISTPNEEQMKKVAESLRKEGFYSQAVDAIDPYDKVKNEIALSLQRSGFDQFISASEQPSSIDIELASGAFFEVGAAILKPEAEPMLQLMAEKILPLAKHDIVIEVEGHTDDTPSRSAQYPSNWELSSARSSTVVTYLIGKGFPAAKLRAVGVAETKPKAPNRDAEGLPIPSNQDLNRRVVLKLIKGEDW
jgi:chemotaxis protein MotB